MRYNIADILMSIWYWFLNDAWPLRFRKEGFAIIKKRLGKPVRVYQKDKERWCWKWPFVEEFDFVDMKVQIFFNVVNSAYIKKENIIPYNLAIDTQVEFRVKAPKVIYEFSNDFNNLSNPLSSIVSNEVHLMIAELSRVKSTSVQKLQKTLDSVLESHRKNSQNSLWRYVDIIRIVITSVDYSVSLKRTE